MVWRAVPMPAGWLAQPPLSAFWPSQPRRCLSLAGIGCRALLSRVRVVAVSGPPPSVCRGALRAHHACKATGLPQNDERNVLAIRTLEAFLISPDP